MYVLATRVSCVAILNYSVTKLKCGQLKSVHVTKRKFFSSPGQEEALILSSSLNCTFLAKPLEAIRKVFKSN